MPKLAYLLVVLIPRPVVDCLGAEDEFAQGLVDLGAEEIRTTAGGGVRNMPTRILRVRRMRYRGRGGISLSDKYVLSSLFWGEKSG